MFRQTAALRLLFRYDIPVKGTEHCCGHGWLWLFFLAEYAEKSFPLRFLRLFLHTCLYDYGYLTSDLIVDGLLLFKYLHNLAHLSFFIIKKIAHTVDTLCRIGNFETAQHTVYCHTPGMVMFQIVIIPFQYRFTQ